MNIQFIKRQTNESFMQVVNRTKKCTLSNICQENYKCFAFGKCVFLYLKAKWRKRGKKQTISYRNWHTGIMAKPDRSKRERNQSEEKAKRGPFEFSFGSKADFAISNFHDSVASTTANCSSQAQGSKQLEDASVEYGHMRQTNSSSYLLHIGRLSVCLCVCRHIFCLHAERFSFRFSI